MYGYIVTFAIGVCTGVYTNNEIVCSRIRKAAAGYLDDIAFRGGIIGHLKCLCVLEDYEVKDVIFKV